MVEFDKSEMHYLSVDEVNAVSGGNPVYVAMAVAGAYLTVLDAAWDFGAGLGNGLYDALH